MRVFLLMTCILTLAACGGRNSGSTASATGPISRACLAADRSAASPRLCGCVQSVANRELSSADRSRLESFFANPERANDIKISDTRANDAFWDRYRSFISAARSQCG